MAEKFVLGEMSEKHPFVLKIKKVLEDATKQKIVVTVVDKLTRKVGVPTKKITFNFEEGQSISLLFRVDGDVIQHSLNNKNIPLFRPMDYDKIDDFNAGLEDLALKLKSNQEKFNIKRMSARVVIPRTTAPAPTVKKRIQQARETLIELTEVFEDRKASVDQKKAELATLQLEGGINV